MGHQDHHDSSSHTDSSYNDDFLISNAINNLSIQTGGLTSSTTPSHHEGVTATTTAAAPVLNNASNNDSFRRNDTNRATLTRSNVSAQQQQQQNQQSELMAGGTDQVSSDSKKSMVSAFAFGANNNNNSNINNNNNNSNSHNTSSNHTRQQDHQEQDSSISSNITGTNLNRYNHKQHQQIAMNPNQKPNNNNNKNNTSNTTATNSIVVRHRRMPWYYRICSCCFYESNPKRRRRKIQYFLDTSMFWRYLLLFNTFILLFGGTMRDLILDNECDIVMNCIILQALLVFTIDIILRIDSETNYFNFYCCMQNKDHLYNPLVSTDGGVSTINLLQQNPDHRHHQQQTVGWGTTLCCSVGSFLFWCDLISTCSLIYEISWFNPAYFSKAFYTIEVNELGQPYRSSWVGERSFVNVGISTASLFIVIAKTARMARFIRSPLILKYSANINWYFFVNILSPMWWLRCFCFCLCCCWYSPQNNKDKNMNGSIMNQTTASSGMIVSANASSLNRSGQTLLDPMAPSGGRVNARMATSSATRQQGNANHSYSSNRQLSTNRLPSFVKTSKMRINAAEQPGTWKALLRNVLRGAQSEESKRHKAATVIQRAWRRKRDDDYDDLYDDYYGYESSAYFGGSNVAGSNNNNIADANTLKHAGHRHRNHPYAASARSSSSTISNTLMKASGKMFTNIRQSIFLVGGGGKHHQSPPVPPRNEADVTVRSNVNNNDGNDNNNIKRRIESHVGSAMRELTGQRVAIGIMLALLVTVWFNYLEIVTTKSQAMILLHTQTARDPYWADQSINTARSTSIPTLFQYQFMNGNIREYNISEVNHRSDSLLPREIIQINVKQINSISYNNGYENNNNNDNASIGQFSIRLERRQQTVVTLISTIFMILIWFFGATGFAGPVMILVVIPMERMVRLLAMLTVDPLGYQSTTRYRRFVDEEDEITKNTRWTKELLKGMETSFLMSTILRIGSLMKVGFGSAGVEIIRKSLEKGQSRNMLILTNQGSTVSCVFLFCDIRGFTDATECLQEEVFVFTNRIAAVVHSHCAAYGGSANKNIGDAFLMSWLLDSSNDGGFIAKKHQADKALLAVVRMCMALRYDDFYLSTMSEWARDALVKKLSERPGPIVQMGFGLHAGKSVQGAIGSQKKIDATYVSESVERAEFLESSTKKYGVPMLMSDSFHRLLDQRNKRRCRKIDQILMDDDNDEESDGDGDVCGEVMDLITFDIDIDAWWNHGFDKTDGNTKSPNEADVVTEKVNTSKRKKGKRMSLFSGSMSHNDDTHGDGASQIIDSDFFPDIVAKAKRKMTMLLGGGPTEEMHVKEEGSGVFGRTGKVLLVGAEGGGHHGPGEANAMSMKDKGIGREFRRPATLTLPTGPIIYNANAWLSDDMRKVRERYSDGIFFQKFNQGLQSFYSKDWDHATSCFTTVLARFEDGPSRYFLTIIEENGGKPPKNFRSYGRA